MRKPLSYLTLQCTVTLCLIGLFWFTVVPQTLWAQDATPPVVAAPPTITIGLHEDEVHQPLAELLRLLLIDQGFTVTESHFADTPSLITALEEGAIDLAIALPVDALVLHHGLPLNALPTAENRLLELVDSLAAKAELTWLTAARIDQHYAFFAVADPAAPSTATTTISLPQLGSFPESAGAAVTLCTAQEDGVLLAHTLQALAESYAIQFAAAQQTLLAHDALTQALSAGTCDLFFARSAGRATADTNAQLSALPDPDQFFPPNPPTLIARQALLAAEPAIALQWRALATAVDAQALAALQATPDATSTSADQENATQFLLDRGLLQRPTITVSARDETAQQLLGAMIVQLLTAAGYPVIDRTGSLHGAEAVAGVELSDTEITIALVGELLTQHSLLPIAELPKELPEAMALINRRQAEQGLVALTPAAFTLAPVLLVDEDLAGLGVTSLSRLANYMKRYESPFTLCVDSTFFSHPLTGLSGLEKFYGFQFAPEKILLMDEDTSFSAIQERQCQVTVGTITDGRVAAWHLLPLRDDQGFFPLNNPLAVTQQSLLDHQPQLAALLESYLPYLDTTTMQQLTTRVELGADGIYLSGDEETAAQVATAFLLEHQLLAATEPAASSANGSGVVTVEQLDAEQLDEFEELPGLSTARQLDE